MSVGCGCWLANGVSETIMLLTGAQWLAHNDNDINMKMRSKISHNLPLILRVCIERKIFFATLTVSNGKWTVQICRFACSRTLSTECQVLSYLPIYSNCPQFIHCLLFNPFVFFSRSLSICDTIYPRAQHSRCGRSLHALLNRQIRNRANAMASAVDGRTPATVFGCILRLDTFCRVANKHRTMLLRTANKYTTRPVKIKINKQMRDIRAVGVVVAASV